VDRRPVALCHRAGRGRVELASTSIPPLEYRGALEPQPPTPTHLVSEKARCVVILDREMATFRANLPELLVQHAGRFVLIHGDDVVGVWDTKDRALEEGYERFLPEAFLVKQIVAHDPPVFVAWLGA